MNVKQLVEKAYSLLGIKKGWQIREADPFTYIRSRLEAIGITVFVNGVVGSNNNRKLLVSEFRGFTLLDSYAPIIFINGRDSSNGKLFTIIHEFCHVLLGEEGGVSDGNSEPYCNRFAAEFLVPESLFHSRWSESPQAYEQIAKYFKVSQYVIYRVALTHGYINQRQYELLVKKFEQYLQNIPERTSQSGGGNFYATAHIRLGESFSRAVVQAARAGALAYREAYELLGLRGNTFSKYVNKYGF
ncbi:ImmA/IrrE family metallo-endopeptidase [Veillonella rogosae]|uniref:ImmA/IrrE family metallo-endopeptidase n=1 Tax=Veillonella rogosae TaxID=423477 RepID=UPI0006D0E863|nr:ImmA/IrrE family metallo-endopeptidase [Veillonella rogosae]